MPKSSQKPKPQSPTSKRAGMCANCIYVCLRGFNVCFCNCVAVVLFVLVASGRHNVAVVAGGASTPKKKQKSQPEGEFAYGTTRETIEIDMEDWERFKGFPYYHDVYSLECTDVTFV